MGVSELSVRLAREDWRSGERFVERILADPKRAPIARVVMQELERELRRRLGQTYTLAMLVALYGDADRWARDAAQRSRPRSAGRTTPPSPTPPARARPATRATGAST